MTAPPLISLHDLDLATLREVLVSDGVKPQHSATLWRVLQRDGVATREGLLAAGFLPPPQRWVE